MKKVPFYILFMLVFISCTTEDETVKNDQTLVVFPELHPMDDNTRSTLSYDVSSNKMLFSWDADDKLGVFLLSHDEFLAQDEISQFVYKQKEDGQNALSSLSRKFVPQDPDFAITAGETYSAYMPIVNNKVGYEDIMVSYLDQVAEDVAKYYYQRNTEEHKADYPASEKIAGHHLGAYDYMVSEQATSDAANNITFNMKRMGAVLRFFLQVPTLGEVVDSIHVFNESKEFTVKATINVKEKTMMPAVTSHVISLKFNKGEDGKIKGIPTDKSNNIGLYNTAGTKAYIITYMMAGPINLQGDDVKNSVLYMFTHDGENKLKVYKSGALSKPNLGANDLYLWTVTNPTDDEFITFVPLTVQQWKEETGITNDGKDTGSW